MTVRINEEKRREWLRSLRRFKQGVRLRARLGVVTIYCQEVALRRKGLSSWSAPDWDHDKWVTRLYTAIRDEEFPPELLTGFVESAEVTFLNLRKQPTSQDAIDAMNDVCTRLSKRLRQKFGVFG
jgi:hypothetical protein